MLGKINDILETILKKCLIVLIFFLLITVAIQILNRYIIPWPLVWTEELARIIFFWLVFLGASIGLRNGEHFMVDILITRVSPKVQRIFLWISFIVTFITVLGIIFVGYQFSLLGLIRWSSTMNIPLIFVFFAIPAGGFFMFMFLLETFFNLIRQ